MWIFGWMWLIGEIGVGVVARTNRGLAQAGIPRSGHHADLPRNNLPQPVHSNPRGAQERITGASPIRTNDAARETRDDGRPAAWADRGWPLHPTPSCGGGGPGDSRSLGWRSPCRIEEYAQRHLSGTPVA